MSCTIKITSPITGATFNAMREIVGWPAVADLDNATLYNSGIRFAADDEDDFCDLEAFCVERAIGFTRTTAEPSQMGQEPHKVTFQPGMGRPAVEFL